jgi:hypothetical protein
MCSDEGYERREMQMSDNVAQQILVPHCPFNGVKKGKENPGRHTCAAMKDKRERTDSDYR